MARPDKYQYVDHEKPWRYREGDLTVTRTSAWSGPGCHLGCGVLLYTDDAGKLVKVEGDPENPFNKGRLCPRCLDMIESVYNSDPDLYEECPLILTTGARNWTLFHSEHRQVPRLRAYRPDPILQIHPEAAAKYGVAEGDWVWVENHRGRAKRKVQFCELEDLARDLAAKPKQVLYAQ